MSHDSCAPSLPLSPPLPLPLPHPPLKLTQTWVLKAPYSALVFLQESCRTFIGHILETGLTSLVSPAQQQQGKADNISVLPFCNPQCVAPHSPFPHSVTSLFVKVCAAYLCKYPIFHGKIQDESRLDVSRVVCRRNWAGSFPLKFINSAKSNKVRAEPCALKYSSCPQRCACYPHAANS